jgi:AcrR family transcriptional regulator
MPTPQSGADTTPTSRPGDLRRAQILAAAATLFARSGFHGTSIDELGAAVGTSGPAIYRYFPSKEAILTTLLVDISTSLLDGGRARAIGATGQEAVDALVDWHVSFALDNPTLITLQNRDFDALPPTEERRVRRLQRAYVDIWAGAISSLGAGLDRAAALAAAHAAFGLINSTPHSARLDPTSMARLLRTMVRAAIFAVVADPPRQSPC